MARARDGKPQRCDQRTWPLDEAPLSARGREFLAYWRGKCPHGGGWPTRADIRPEEMLSLLPYVFMVDVLPQTAEGPDYHFRLVGTAIMELEGEHTGRLLSQMFPDRQSHAAVWDQYRDAVLGTIRVRQETLRWGEDNEATYEVILLPLQDESGKVGLLVGLAHALET